jgi:hypothetical protein
MKIELEWLLEGLREHKNENDDESLVTCELAGNVVGIC